MSADLVLLPLGVATGAVTQRVTGIGFALVSAPILVLVAGPFEGVLLANILAAIVAAVVLASTWRDTEWRRGLLLAVPALAAVPLGAFVAKHVPSAPLMVVVGALVLLALAAVWVSPDSQVFAGRRGAVGAGAASGFMNATAGVGGPAIVLYALSTRWEHDKFRATFQFFTILVNVASVVSKGMPHTSTATLALAVVALVVGLGLGEFASRRVSAERARRLVFLIAFVGACSTVLKGALAW